MGHNTKYIEKMNFSKIHELFNMESDKFEDYKSRLFPIEKNINERFVVSIFLSSLGAVKEYREALIQELSISKISNKTAKLHLYTEIPLDGVKRRVELMDSLF